MIITLSNSRVEPLGCKNERCSESWFIEQKIKKNTRRFYITVISLLLVATLATVLLVYLPQQSSLFSMFLPSIIFILVITSLSVFYIHEKKMSENDLTIALGIEGKVGNFDYLYIFGKQSNQPIIRAIIIPHKHGKPMLVNRTKIESDFEITNYEGGHINFIC